MICVLLISVCCVGYIPVFSYVPHFPCFVLRALCMHMPAPVCYSLLFTITCYVMFV